MSARKRKRPNVALIVESSHASGRNILRGIARYVREHGPWSIFHEFRNTDSFFPEWIKSWRGDGIIARVESDRIAAALDALHVPVVDLLGSVSKDGFPLVHPDDAAIAEMAADHLLERGFRCFAFCGVKSYNWSDSRRDFFAEKIGDEGYPCHLHAYPESDDPHDFKWERDQEALKTWLLRLPKPTGVFTCSDQHGRIVLDACRRGGIHVPDELAVIGVDNDVPLCEVCDPPLSSVIPDDEQVGYEAAGLLASLMAGGTWNDGPIWIEPRGVETRLSTDTLAMEDRLVAKALQFIREHSCEGITVDDVVLHAHMSRSLLQRRFKEAVGRTLHDEILLVRLNQARFLLEESDMSIAWVAEKSGFKHQAYFGKVFHREVGVTPLRYRREHQRN